MSFNSVPHVLIKFCSSEDWVLIDWGDRWIEEEKYAVTRRREAPSNTHTYTPRLPPPLPRHLSDLNHKDGNGWVIACAWSHVWEQRWTVGAAFFLLTKEAGGGTIKKAWGGNDAAIFKPHMLKNLTVHIAASFDCINVNIYMAPGNSQDRKTSKPVIFAALIRWK